MMRSRTAKPGFSLDYVMWIFMRISAIFMFALAMMAVLGAFIIGARAQGVDAPTILRWTFFPNPNHVVNYVPDLALGWANGLWGVMQLLILFMAVTHGFNGLRIVVEDYTDKSFLQAFFRGLVLLLWLGALIVSALVVWADWPA